MASYNKRISDQSKVKFNPINRELEDSENSELDSRVDALEENITGSKTATGNPITVIDAAPVNAVNLSMDLEPIQDLHGYDHPWVGGAGKNKLPMTVDGIKALNTVGTWSGNVYSIYGVTLEILVDSDNNVIGLKISGNSSGNIDIKITDNFDIQSNSILNASASANTSSVVASLYVNGLDGVDANNWVSGSYSISSGTNSYVGLYINTNYNNTIIIKPMIRLSTETDSSFAPYTNICPISGRTEEIITQKDNPTNPTVTKTYTIQFGQTVYGGTLDVTKGELVVDKAYEEFDGSSDENWVKYNSGSASAYAMQTTLSNLIAVSDDDKKVKIIANELESIAYNGAWGEYDAFVCKNNTTETSGLITGVRSITTVPDWKTYLASNPLQVVYEIATPITIPLTPQQIKLLENANTVYTDYEGDTIHIEYQPNNAMGELLGEVNDIYDSIITDIYAKIKALDTRVTALEEA